MMEPLLSDIIDFLPDATMGVDMEKRVIIWNKAIENMTGIPAAEMIGKGDHACIVPFYGEARPHLLDLVFEDREELAARYPHISRKGDTLRAEVYCPALYNGKGAWVSDKASSLHDKNGNVIGAIESIRDISGSKRAEEALKYTLSLVNATLESTNDGILVVDMERRITRWNQKFVDLWHIPEELLNMEVKIPVLYHIGSQMVQPDEFIAKAMELYENPELSSYDTLNLIDGRVIRRFSQPQKIGATTVGRVWSFDEVTDIKKSEEERRLLKQQFYQAQKMESLGVLAGGIAHDFNNILTVILGYCYMAKDDMLSGEEYKSAFAKVESAGNRAADLCRQMLTYAGKSPLIQTKVNLWLLVDEVLRMLQSAITKNVTIESALNRDIPEIAGDSGQLQQIIMNLIINASEAIGDKNGTVRVVLSIKCIETDQTATDRFGTVVKAGRYICLEVSDDGIGMDEETQKRIFEPFYTTKFTGRGLGMSAIHGIIKAHEGLLHVRSTPGVGTAFKICLPVHNINGHVENVALSPATAGNAGGTVLLVDDEQTLREMGKKLLGPMGYTVLTSDNGVEAVELYRQKAGEIDVVLLDIIMPLMGGIEAYHELRAIDRTLPIIFCSGYSAELVEDVINNDPYAGFVHKPYDPMMLRDVIGRMKR